MQGQFIFVADTLEENQETAIHYLNRAQKFAEGVDGANMWSDLVNLRSVLYYTSKAYLALNLRTDHPLRNLFNSILEKEKKLIEKYDNPQGYYNNQGIIQVKNKLELIRTNFQYKSMIREKLGENLNERVQLLVNQDKALLSDGSLENLTAKLQESNFLCAKFLRDEFQVKDIDGKALTEDSRRAGVWYYFFGYNGIVNILRRAPSRLLGWLSKAFSRSSATTKNDEALERKNDIPKENEETNANSWNLGQGKSENLDKAYELYLKEKSKNSNWFPQLGNFRNAFPAFPKLSKISEIFKFPASTPDL